MGWIAARRLAVLAAVFIVAFAVVRAMMPSSPPPGAATEVTAARTADYAGSTRPADASNSTNDTAVYWAAFVTLIVGAGWTLARVGRTGPDGSWRAQDAHYGAAMFAAYHTPGHSPGPADCGASSGFGGDCGGSF